jgi:predicted MPP superfamily phosphohydrolase
MKIDRREFVVATVTLLGGIPFSLFKSTKGDFKPIRFGIVTDIHYADRPNPDSSTRYYKESLGKLSECIDLMNQQQVDFLIELGDFKDQGASPKEKETLVFLSTVEKEFRRFNGPRYHVLGNHDHDSISKQQFLDNISNEGFIKASGYYSFDRNSFHFIILDANYTSQGRVYDHGKFDWTDAHIPEDQLEWLKNDLHTNKIPAVIFLHHRLDTPPVDKLYCPNNADIVRKMLEDAGNVVIVFQGHYHEGGLSRLNNIHYYTLKALIEGSGPENNNYAIVEIDKDLIVHIKGYRKTESLDLH